MVNTYEVKITQQAQEQMEEIVDYVSRELFAPEAAKSLLNKLENTIMSLSVFPEKHKLTDEEPWRSDGIRKVSVSNFLVYYWINKVESRVYVTAVIYDRRDQLEQLKIFYPYLAHMYSPFFSNDISSIKIDSAHYI